MSKQLKLHLNLNLNLNSDLDSDLNLDSDSNSNSNSNSNLENDFILIEKKHLIEDFEIIKKTNISETIWGKVINKN